LADDAPSDNSGLTPKEQFEEYKKELGKQYMDGLISDTEYDEMLRAKEAELGLNQPVIEEDEGPECPSCGALINEYDTDCNICGIALEPTAIEDALEDDVEVPDAPPVPADELGLDGPSDELDAGEKSCGSCGAVVSEVDTVCVVCGSMLLDAEPTDDVILDKEESKPAISELIDEKPMKDEDVCPSCGAFVENGSTECIICEAPIVPVQAPVAEPDVPTEDEELPPEAVPEPTEAVEPAIEQKELMCAGCGAVLDEGTTECFICGEAVSEAPGEPIPAPEIDVPSEPAPVVDEPEIIDEPPVEEPEPIDVEPVPEPLGEIPDEEPVSAEIPEKIDEPESIDKDILEIQEEVPEAEIVEEIILEEGEIICPSCNSIIPEESDKCPECWTDFALYVRCPACTLLTPSGEDSCRECFAPLDIPEEITDETHLPGEMDLSPMDVEIPDEMEITEELMEEMSTLEVEEEQGKECLVCGAIFGPEDEVCPICFMEFGTEIDEPESVEYETWETMEVGIQPTKYLCPNCGENVTGLDASERELNEGKWFYRGILTIFTGIFFTSFSIWARGVSVENDSLGLNPPPTDVVLNLVGWILVLMGFLFWFMSWKLHEELIECQECGIEINTDMANCINCGVELADEEGMGSEEYAEEDYPEEPVPEALPETYEELPYEEIEEVHEVDYQEEILEEPITEEDIEDFDTGLEPEPAISDDIPEETPELEELVEDIESVPTSASEPIKPVPAVPEPEGPGAELPVEHEEHRECPGCGIFVDLEDSICPVCDTEFEAVGPSISDEEIDIQSEEEELSGFGVEAEPEPVEPVDEITVPEEDAEHIECPSCGADVAAGTPNCPVCEYPLAS